MTRRRETGDRKDTRPAGGPRNPVQLGVVGAAHGIRGEVRVKPFTDDPLALGRYGPLYTAAGRMLKIVRMRPARNVVIVRFDGVDDRDGAETLTGEALFVDRAALPQALEEEEFYHADLIGLPAFDETGEEIGTVIAVHNFGAGDILEIRPAAGPTLMVPFTHDAVPEVDLDEGAVRLDSVAAGLDRRQESAGAAPVDPRARPRGPKEAGGNR
ncbi:ribosome maturation factor RimM [Chelativorans intermedius]|uniref:Ribosome maturation factor RimM n=1 Tax=Chelativorans intermedius TaxID=515947 RepID=A0ABV6D7D4_9HYPH|nr:ribosome maturation factor RimM [Chelativorans intermedius]MCT8999247.1 ribosome maturation factor RimM [Chelativorans intermedius]